jgi:hypothetical protein
MFVACRGCGGGRGAFCSDSLLGRSFLMEIEEFLAISSGDFASIKLQFLIK